MFHSSSKRVYQRVAEGLLKAKPPKPPERDGTTNSTQAVSRLSKVASYTAWEAAVKSVASTLSEGDEDFDWDRFVAAAGLDQ